MPDPTQPSKQLPRIMTPETQQSFRNEWQMLRNGKRRVARRLAAEYGVAVIQEYWLSRARAANVVRGIAELN